ncbi:hypothetical protein BH20ACT5_BH20ACT5_23850 [soil metagenome]
MPVTGPRPLAVGHRAPGFLAPGLCGVPALFYGQVGGRPSALVFTDDPAVASGLGRALAGRDDIAGWVVGRAPESAGLPTWADPDGTLRARYGVPARASVAVVLDPNLRVATVLAGTDLDIGLVGVLDSLLPAEPVVEVRGQAPVLFVPNALAPDYRSRLIELWGSGAAETGVQRSAGEAVEPALKRRRDHIVTAPELLRELAAVVGRAVLPEVVQAFGFRARRFEGFKIGCYEASTGGLFRAHRDNLSPATAHRSFALTLNLSGDYAGGQLRFPEYGAGLYRPDAGAALVFSCSLLHEVVEVTRGRRFVLLSFLSGDSPERAG